MRRPGAGASAWHRGSCPRRNWRACWNGHCGVPLHPGQPFRPAANPLEDFLDRTQAGHCEYFASAMALMLRARGVPARVVNGFRLGPWIPEGGYFRVSQDQAHSWVEYWDQGGWHVADPTPAAAGRALAERPSASASSPAGSTPCATTGIATWCVFRTRTRWPGSPGSRPRSRAGSGAGRPRRPASPGDSPLLAAGWIAWRTRALWRPVPPGPGSIRALRPLLARTRRVAAPRPARQPGPGCSGSGHPTGEHGALLRLADAVETEAYGGRRQRGLRPGEGRGRSLAGLETPYFSMNFSKAFMSSMGSGKTMVLFFSTAISVRVCR